MARNKKILNKRIENSLWQFLNIQRSTIPDLKREDLMKIVGKYNSIIKGNKYLSDTYDIIDPSKKGSTNEYLRNLISKELFKNAAKILREEEDVKKAFQKGAEKRSSDLAKKVKEIIDKNGKVINLEDKDEVEVIKYFEIDEDYEYSKEQHDLMSEVFKKLEEEDLIIDGQFQYIDSDTALDYIYGSIQDAKNKDEKITANKIFELIKNDLSQQYGLGLSYEKPVKKQSKPAKIARRKF